MINVLDNFLPDPLAYREEQLSQPFYTVRGPDGIDYKNISVRPTDIFDSLLSERLGKKVRSDYALTRINYEGEFPNNAVHTDNGYSQLAVVLYLNLPEQCQGGTAFYRHKRHGWTSFPTFQEVQRTGKSMAKIIATLAQDANNPEAWDLGIVENMAFNRAIVYETKLFHSRYPWAAFGKTKETARLVHCGFFSEV